MEANAKDDIVKFTATPCERVLEAMIGQSGDGSGIGLKVRTEGTARDKTTIYPQSLRIPRRRELDEVSASCTRIHQPLASSSDTMRSSIVNSCVCKMVSVGGVRLLLSL